MFSRKALTKLIVPLVIEQFLAVLVGMADIMMVSSAGEAAVSSVALVDLINLLILNIFAALATGGAVVAAQAIGARDRERASHIANQLIYIVFGISVVITILVLLLKGPLLRLLFGQVEQTVMAGAISYFAITALSYPFIAVYNGGAALFRAMGNSKVSMGISALMNAINIAGNALCVFGLGMGVEGVALPSVVSRAVAAVVILLLLRNPRNLVHLEHLFSFRFDPPLMSAILRIGIPNSLENSVFQLGRVLLVSLISTFGTVQIAANAVANNLDGMGVIPGKAISLAMITVVGRCVGARDDEQAIYYTRKLTLWAYIAMALSNGAILIFLPKLIGIYALSGETMVLSELLVQIHAACAILLWSPSFVLPNALRAANDVKFTMVVSILSMAVWRLGFSYLLCSRLGWGAVGVWIAMVIDWICRVTCFALRFGSGAWKTKYQA